MSQLWCRYRTGNVVFVSSKNWYAVKKMKTLFSVDFSLFPRRILVSFGSKLPDHYINGIKKVPVLFNVFWY